jgi:hypothetical protein
MSMPVAAQYLAAYAVERRGQLLHDANLLQY